MDYTKSTQRKFWLLTPEQIVEGRKEVHEKVIIMKYYLICGLLIYHVYRLGQYLREIFLMH